MKRYTTGFAELLRFMRYGALLPGALGLTVVLLCIALLVAFVGWLPAWRDHQAAERDFQARREALVQSARAVQLVRAHQAAEQALAQVEQKLQSTMGEAELIQRIARAAGQRGARLTSQAFDHRQDGRGDTTRQLTLGLLGSYAAVRGLLVDLAALPVWIEVLEARIESDGGSQVQAQLRVLTYRSARELQR